MLSVGASATSQQPDQDQCRRGRPRQRNHDRDREPIGDALEPRPVEGAADEIRVHGVGHRAS